MTNAHSRPRTLWRGALLVITISVVAARLSRGAATRPAPPPRSTPPRFVPVVAATPSPYLSPVALCADRSGKYLYVSEASARRLAVFDVDANKVARHIPLGGEPAGLTLSPDGRQLFAAIAAPRGEIVIIDTRAGSVKARLRVGHTPTAVVLAPDGATLYVCNRFDNSIAIVSLRNPGAAVHVAVPREPVAAALTGDGRWLFVANHLPAGPANGPRIAAAVSVIDTARRRVASTIVLPDGSTSVRGLCLSPDGQFAYVTHLLSHYQVPTTQVERGWMNTNAVSIIRVAPHQLLNTFLLDDVDLGAANPWGVACTADGRWLCVAQSGTHELSVIDRAALHAKLTKLENGEKVPGTAASSSEVPGDLAFLGELRRRVPLPGNGPRGVAIIGSRVFASEYFSDSLAVVNLNGNGPVAGSTPMAAAALSLGTPAPPDKTRTGEMVFHDGNGCFQKWQSCASCHPDGRVDGLNWDLLNDGLGNPKNTRNMLFTHRLPPVMSLGVRATAEVAVRAGFKFIQFAERPESDYEAVDAYLKSLRPVPSPRLVDGALSPQAKRGHALFIKAGCAECHSGPLFTALQKFDMGTGQGLDHAKTFVTPTLREVWRTAPYLHDGRAATLRDVVTRENTLDRHGRTSQLSAREIAELVAYLESL